MGYRKGDAAPIDWEPAVPRTPEHTRHEAIDGRGKRTRTTQMVREHHHTQIGALPQKAKVKCKPARSVNPLLKPTNTSLDYFMFFPRNVAFVA